MTKKLTKSISDDSMVGVGRGAGEPPEAAWSQLGPYGYTLQYRSLPSRQVSLEHIVANFNNEKLQTLPGLLLRSARRAEAAQKEAENNVAELQGYAEQAGISLSQVSFSFFLLQDLSFSTKGSNNKSLIEMNYADLAISALQYSIMKMPC